MAQGNIQKNQHSTVTAIHLLRQSSSWSHKLLALSLQEIRSSIMMNEDPISPENPRREQIENGNSIFSPRFRSVAAMAGWDEEALLNASLVVEDTPDRDVKQKRPFDLQFKTPPTNNSRRKRKAQRKSPAAIPATVLNLDEDEISREESLQNKDELKAENGEVNRLVSIPIVVLNLDDDDATSREERLQNKEEPKVIDNGEMNKPEGAVDSFSSAAIPCMDKLREELSCAICLEICYEPSTTSCGHSFCKKCLRSAADKCGKRCPKCRQLISNGRSCTVNTVLWNTIQLLFPQEVESRNASSSSKPSQSPVIKVSRNRTIQALNSPDGESLNLERRRTNQYLRNRTRGDNPLTRRRRRDPPSQDEDAALAMRLQREEFMGGFMEPDEQQQHRQNSFVLVSERLRGDEERRTQEQQQHRRSSVSLARTNLRAIASRAVNIRLRGRQT